VPSAVVPLVRPAIYRLPPRDHRLGKLASALVHVARRPVEAFALHLIVVADEVEEDVEQLEISLTGTPRLRSSAVLAQPASPAGPSLLLMRDKFEVATLRHGDCAPDQGEIARSLRSRQYQGPPKRTLGDAGRAVRPSAYGGRASCANCALMIPAASMLTEASSGVIAASGGSNV